MLSKILGLSRNGYVPFKATVYSQTDYLEAVLAAAGEELDIAVMSRHAINSISVFRVIPRSSHKQIRGGFVSFIASDSSILSVSFLSSEQSIL